MKFLRRLMFILPAVPLILGAAGSADAATKDSTVDKHPTEERRTGKPVPGQYIVTLKPGQNPRNVAAVAKVSPKWVYENALSGFTAQLNQGQLNALRHHSAVEAIEPDQEITTTEYYTESMDLGAQPWGLDRIDQRSGRSNTFTWWQSGDYGAGFGVHAYIIDSGIATAHPDFGGRAQNVYDAFGGNGEDCNGHGTHVAATVGGARYGVAKRVSLKGIRVLDCATRFANGSVGSAVAGIDWLRMNAIKPAVANMSFHAGFRSSALNTATANLVNSGVFVAAAAANDNRDACTDSPGSAAGTVTVAATDYRDIRASFSNFGPCVDLYAPGVTIQSATVNGGTTTMNGTSMASPHVAGVAALLKSDYGDLASSTVASTIIRASTTDVVYGNIVNTPNRMLFMSGW